MGLFSFIKDVGAKIFGSKKEEAPVATATIDPGAEDRAKEKELTTHVQMMDIQVDNLLITVADDRATVYGQVQTQADKEKVILTIGNVNGIAEVDDNLEVLNPAPEAVFYTVQKGDTLSLIAKAQYGDMMKYPVIFEANKPMLTHPDKIYPGQVLRIPALDATA